MTTENELQQVKEALEHIIQYVLVDDEYIIATEALESLNKYTKRLKSEELVDGWQPIETAPEDGRFIYICTKYVRVESNSGEHDEEVGAAICRYDPSPFSELVWECQHLSHESIAYALNPTHWMPRPPLPKGG